MTFLKSHVASILGQRWDGGEIFLVVHTDVAEAPPPPLVSVSWSFMYVTEEFS